MRLSEALVFRKNLPPLIPNTKMHGVKENGRVIGEYTYSIVSMDKVLKGGDPSQRVHYLADLFVEPDRRGEGIGKSLLTRFKEQTPRNIPYLIVTDRKSKSYPLYIREGFVDIGSSVYGGQSRVLKYETK